MRRNAWCAWATILIGAAACDSSSAGDGNGGGEVGTGGVDPSGSGGSSSDVGGTASGGADPSASTGAGGAAPIIALPTAITLTITPNGDPSKAYPTSATLSYDLREDGRPSAVHYSGTLTGSALEYTLHLEYDDAPAECQQPVSTLGVDVDLVLSLGVGGCPSSSDVNGFPTYYVYEGGALISAEQDNGANGVKRINLQHGGGRPTRLFKTDGYSDLDLSYEVDGSTLAVRGTHDLRATSTGSPDPAAYGVEGTVEFDSLGRRSRVTSVLKDDMFEYVYSYD